MWPNLGKRFPQTFTPFVIRTSRTRQNFVKISQKIYPIPAKVQTKPSRMCPDFCKISSKFYPIPSKVQIRSGRTGPKFVKISSKFPKIPHLFTYEPPPWPSNIPPAQPPSSLLIHPATVYFHPADANPPLLSVWWEWKWFLCYFPLQAIHQFQFLSPLSLLPSEKVARSAWTFPSLPCRPPPPNFREPEFGAWRQRSGSPDVFSHPNLVSSGLVQREKETSSRSLSNFSSTVRNACLPAII